jgi:hypothetical protein
MRVADLIALRKEAEAAVADMGEGPAKVEAFKLILRSLLVGGVSPVEPQVSAVVRQSPGEAPSSLAARISLLADEGFLSQPRSLGEIQDSLAQHGWHYPQSNLSTPLVRLVRQRRLRRLQIADGGKRVWKYSLP